jgi:hypothetical protein
MPNDTMAGAMVTVVQQSTAEQMPAELAEMPLPGPWEGIMDTERIRSKLGFRPIYRTVHAASDTGAL